MSLEFINREYNLIPNKIMDRVVGFPESKELALIDNIGKTIPGLVMASFTHYFERIQVEQLSRPDDEKERILKTCYDLIEEMCSSKDDEVVNSVMTEIFENFRCSDDIMHIIEQKFGPITREIFEEWKGLQPTD